MTHPKPPRTANLKLMLGVAFAAVIALLVAASWQFIRVQRVEGVLADSTHALNQSRLENSVATALIETEAGHYEAARQRASEFFTRLQHTVASERSDTPPEFPALLADRDSAITTLSRGDTAALPLMHQIYLRYRAAIARMADVSAGSPIGAPPQ